MTIEKLEKLRKYVEESIPMQEQSDELIALIDIEINILKREHPRKGIDCYECGSPVEVGEFFCRRCGRN